MIINYCYGNEQLLRTINITKSVSIRNKVFFQPKIVYILKTKVTVGGNNTTSFGLSIVLIGIVVE